MRNDLPSQGEPPSSIAAIVQGFVVVSGVGRAILLYVWLQLPLLGSMASTEPSIDVRRERRTSRPFYPRIFSLHY
jgi:hypothetical protein